MNKELLKSLELLDLEDLEEIKRFYERKRQIKEIKCPCCGARLDYLPKWDHPCPCGGDPSWHEEGFAEVKIKVE